MESQVYAFLLVCIFFFLIVAHVKLYLETAKEFSDMFDNIYCINLQDNMDRFSLVEKKAQRANLKISRFSAVDTRNGLFMRYKEFIHPHSLSDIYYALRNKHRLHDSDLTSGAVGCYLSHMSIYKAALSRGEKMIIVFEDDALIPMNFKHQLLQKIKTLPSKWDMLLLGWIPTDRKTVREHRMYSRIHSYILMHAYVINESGMKKMIQYGMPTIRKQIDHMASDHSDLIHIYGIHPRNWIRQKGSFGTNIQIPLLKKKKKRKQKS